MITAENLNHQIPMTANVNAAPKPTLKADIDFRSFECGLDAPHLSDEEAFKFMDALGEILDTFVHLGFGDHPSQRIHSRDQVREELFTMASRIFNAVA